MNLLTVAFGLFVSGCGWGLSTEGVGKKESIIWGESEHDAVARGLRVRNIFVCVCMCVCVCVCVCVRERERERERE